ncbi:tetraacyldisaccharide 4'-kinase [Marinomonas sp. A79]|uniref:Tetraacyldisaccharide 4'-kinase n=1 Tax=Marinomonas vulgaris TaxID=2823372 RepID=A0ABS5HAL4_9GAMM|nr:tetraacyldisaccharide 4'-kinase [Marinomonas vulgaris]MBR7888510.1 tetraacyldisaccharide 4'-kinase [Marinomonas vulgaris]
MSLESLFTRSWYGRWGWTHVFRPLQPLVRYLVAKKRQAFLTNTQNVYKAPVPVIVVGNISVGGTGKSPMVVALCELLIQQGYRPGIVSRGHGAKITSPISVDENSSVQTVGDEPVMLARRSKCPLVVCPKRVDAVRHLLANHDVDVVISDDGMQHYHLQRDIEIAMLDAKRGLGNSQLLPVGPLREPTERLASVDFIVSVTNAISPALQKISWPVTLATLVPTELISLDGQRRLDFQAAFEPNGTTPKTSWHVVAGIGNPERFMDTLYDLGLSATNSRHSWFSDHHQFTSADIPTSGAVIMTEKDAVKCQSLVLENTNVWYLPVSLILSEAFQRAFLDKLNLITTDFTHE